MENPFKMDDLGVPLFLETPIWIKNTQISCQRWAFKEVFQSCNNQNIATQVFAKTLQNLSWERLGHSKMFLEPLVFW